MRMLSTDFIPFPISDGTSAVELAQDEFHHIYELIKGCLSKELLGEDYVDDDAEFIRKCRIALQNERSSAKHHDFVHGFLPLYEKLYEARANTVVAGYDTECVTVRF